MCQPCCKQDREMQISTPQGGVSCSRRQARQLQQLAGAAAKRRQPGGPGIAAFLRLQGPAAGFCCFGKALHAHTASVAQHTPAHPHNLNSDFCQLAATHARHALSRFTLNPWPVHGEPAARGRCGRAGTGCPESPRARAHPPAAPDPAPRAYNRLPDRLGQENRCIAMSMQQAHSRSRNRRRCISGTEPAWQLHGRWVLRAAGPGTGSSTLQVVTLGGSCSSLWSRSKCHTQLTHQAVCVLVQAAGALQQPGEQAAVVGRRRGDVAAAALPARVPGPVQPPAHISAGLRLSAQR
jgi:hypothetical protein